MPKFFIRGDRGQIIGTKDGEIFTRVIGGTTYSFGEADGTITEISSGWKVPGKTLAAAHGNLRKAAGSEAARFASAVRIGAALAMKHPAPPPLPPLPGPKLPPLPGVKN